MPTRPRTRGATAKRGELVALLRRVARERLTHAHALAAYDDFAAGITAEGHHAAGELLDGARDQVFTCLRPEIRARTVALVTVALPSDAVAVTAQ
jgi:hypothetical protein